MPNFMDRLRRESAISAPRLCLYGPPGLGKTSLAAEFPNAVFIQTEDGTPADVEINTFGKVNSFAEVMEAISTLRNEKHDFTTVVIDSLDKFEPYVWAFACEENGWKDIETPGYGKGYLGADAIWREYLTECNALRLERGVTVIHIAHSEVGRFDDPQTTSYSRFDLRLHKRGNALIQDEMDAILFINQDATIRVDNATVQKIEGQKVVKREVKAVGGGTRWIYTEARPSFVAKNRFGMPEKIVYNRGEGFSALAPFLPGLPAESYPSQQGK